MTKRFCDLCEKPADDGKNKSIQVPFREKGEGKIDGNIGISVYIRFYNRSDGFGGEPDLCEDCREKLLKKLTP